MAIIYGEKNGPARAVVGFDQHSGRWWVGKGQGIREAVQNIAPSTLDPALTFEEASERATACFGNLPWDVRRIDSRRVEILTSREGDAEDVVQFI